MHELTIGLLAFANMTQLDMTGPYEVLRSLAGARVVIIAATKAPVQAEGGMRFLPDHDYGDCPALDIVCVPGGIGVNALVEDAPTLDFVRRQAAGARYVTSVCTGALVLGAAGLLRGRRATTHWASHDLLARVGAIPVAARVVRDGNVFTGGGVTAGIDFALTLVAEIAGEDTAKRIQLHLEYAPAPPFASGSPDLAPAAIVAALRARGAAVRATREALMERVAERLGVGVA